MEWKQRLRGLWRKLPDPIRRSLQLLADAGRRWSDASGAPLGASIAFYTMIALAPLLLVTISISGAVLGPRAAQGQIVGQIESLVGPEAARTIESMIAAAWREPGGVPAALIGIATLLIGATGVFSELRRAMNAMGRITPTASALAEFVRVRLVGFALLLAFGFLAIASLLASAALAAFSDLLRQHLPGLAAAAPLIDLGASVVVLALAFAALLRWLPDRAPSWRSVTIAALTSALLFSAGKLLIGLYLGRASFASGYGAAGSVIVIMSWVYYSAQILLFSAALGRVYDEQRIGTPYGKSCRPISSQPG